VATTTAAATTAKPDAGTTASNKVTTTAAPVVNGTTKKPDPSAPTDAPTGTSAVQTPGESQAPGETTTTTFAVPDGAQKVELAKAIQSTKSAVNVKAEDGVIQLKKAMTMAQVRNVLALEDGYRFVYYDLNNQEITDESANVTVLTNAILYFGEDVEKIFTFEVPEQNAAADDGKSWWIWLVIGGVVVLAGAGAAVLLLLRKKKG